MEFSLWYCHFQLCNTSKYFLNLYLIRTGDISLIDNPAETKERIVWTQWVYRPGFMELKIHYLDSSLA